MKKTYYFVASFLLVGLGYYFFAIEFNSSRSLKFYENFNSTDIKSQLEYHKIGYQGCVFRVKGIDREFVFYPLSNELNNYKIFDKIAEKGDTIIKPAYSDTLRLVKKGVVYKYTFQKFE